MQSEQLVKKLNVKNRFLRQLILICLKKRENKEPSLKPQEISGANLNIRTSYSFSPYSPSFAAYRAYRSGIKIAGVCDFATTAASQEFIKSCKILGLKAVVGLELLVKSPSLGQFTAELYGINKANEEYFTSALENFRELLTKRAQAAAESINKTLNKFDMSLSFEEDVLPLIELKKDSVIMLKHVFMAEAQKIIEKYGKGQRTADFVRDELCLELEEGEYNLLCDSHDPFYQYDLLSTLRKHTSLKSDETEFPSVKTITSLAHDAGLICVYEYESRHGWLELETDATKAIEEFKLLLDKVKEEGFNAISLISREYGKKAFPLFVNAAREKEMLVVLNDKTEYPRNLFKSNPPEESRQYLEACAYAVLGNSISISECLSDGMFSDKTVIKCPSFEERLGVFSAIGRKGD